MIETIKGLPDHVLGVSAVGTVTDQDYRDVLIPLAEEKMIRHGRVSVLYEIGQRFERFEAKALMDDAAFGLRHRREFERVALVSDVDWIRNMTRLMAFMLPCPVRVFACRDMAEAERWITGAQAGAA